MSPQLLEACIVLIVGLVRHKDQQGCGGGGREDGGGASGMDEGRGDTATSEV